MKHTLEQFCRGLEATHDGVRARAKGFCDMLGVSVFAYVRISDSGQASWVTSNPDQDRFLLQSVYLDKCEFIETKDSLSEGAHLWFCDQKFPGSDTFYKERAKKYQMDHGMVLVKHQKGYLETCCFSGLLAKKPLYNLFVNKKELFSSFMKHFVDSLDRKILSHLHDGLSISEIKSEYGKTKSQNQDFSQLAALFGYQDLLLLSGQEKRCLLLLKEGFSYPAIGKKLHLSPRTIEHYIESIKNKLGLEERPELYLVAEKLVAFGLD